MCPRRKSVALLAILNAGAQLEEAVAEHREEIDEGMLEVGGGGTRAEREVR